MTTKAVEPNIIKTEQGRYKARYRDPNGRRKSRTFDRLADARSFLKKVNADLQRGEYTDPKAGRRPFSEAVTLWKRSMKWRRYTPKTAARYESVLANHVIPRLGSVPLSRLDYATLTSFVADLQDEGMSPSTVHKVWEAVRAPLIEALRAKWFATDPASEVALPRRDRSEMLFLTAGEVRALADAITPRFRPAIYLAAYVGLRAGEVWALRVRDLDLLRGRAHVRRSLVDVEGRLAFGEPKHRKHRTVPLPAFLREMLAEHIATYVGTPADPDALVFTSGRGEPVRHGNFLRRHLPGRPGLPREPEESRNGRTRGEPAYGSRRQARAEVSRPPPYLRVAADPRGRSTRQPEGDQRPARSLLDHDHL